MMEKGEKQTKILTRFWGKIDPRDIEDYKKKGGYKSLAKALRMSQKEVVEQVKESGLCGRGGAGFPTGQKWEITLQQECCERYFICNLDESEPGAFKDRALAENNPHGIIEGLAIGAYAVGAKKAFIYVNGNFREAQKLLRDAIEQAYRYHFLGKGVMGSGFDLEMKVVAGAGAYVCGEESALINSIEGKRGEPRRRPPFACACGLDQKPSTVNNAETLSCVPWIIERGPEKFARISGNGGKNTGTKLYCIDGYVKKPGIYELPIGMNVNEVVFEAAGGMQAGKEFWFAQVGGSSGRLIPMGKVDQKLGYGRDFEFPLGSGSVLVVDKFQDIKELTLSWMRFFQRESCGQCVPCREGTFRAKEILERLRSGDFNQNDREDLEDIIFTLDRSTFCALGKFSVVALKDVIRYGFIEELKGVKL